MRNHWLRIHRIREIKKNAEICFFGVKVQDIIDIVPFSDHVKYKPAYAVVVSGFTIRHKGKDVLLHYFLQSYHMEKGEELNLDLSRITFRV
jgi:hypothetical protein